MDTKTYYKHLLKDFNKIGILSYIKMSDDSIIFNKNDLRKIKNIIPNVKELGRLILLIRLNKLFFYIRKIEDDYFLIEIEDVNIHLKCDQLSELLKLLNLLKNKPYNE